MLLTLACVACSSGIGVTRNENVIEIERLQHYM